MSHAIRAILFDLDGTLLDTAPDLNHALNRLRKRHGMPEFSLSTMRSMANLGSKVLLNHAFGVEANNPKMHALREEFLTYYEEHIAQTTRFFPQMEKVLLQLDKAQIPWGIVTNKLTRHTTELLKALHFDHRPLCVVCGDTLSTSKPDPAPIRYACELLQQPPADCIYIGDAMTDVIASKAAGTKTLVALYGYIHSDENPLDWKADGYINEPLEIIHWIKKYSSNPLT